MTAPTQELPSWLTYSETIVTDSAGDPVATSTTLLYLPLTYYGPSLPLGSLWTYGGLTSPASTVPASQTATTTPTTAIPTSITTSSATPSSSSTSSSFTSELSSSSTSSFSSSISSSSATTSASTVPTSGSNKFSDRKIIAIVIGAAAALIIFFGLMLYVYTRRRRRRQNPVFQYVPGDVNDSSYVIVDPSDPGEGSPRHSGEEADPFLRRESRLETIDESHAHEDLQSPRAAANVSPTDHSKSSKSTGTSSNSGYGTLLATATLGVDMRDSVPPEERRGSILSVEQSRMIEEDEQHAVLPHHIDELGALIPPRLVEPEGAYAGRGIQPLSSSLSARSATPPASATEATFATARRVRAEELGPRSSQQALSPPLPPVPSSSRQDRSSWQRLVDATPLKWVWNGLTPSSPRNSHGPEYTAAGLSDEDIAVGRSLLPPPMSERRSNTLGLGPDGQRPISNVSARSAGSTVYHDARSSISTSQGRNTPKLTPPPRAVTEHGAWPLPPLNPLVSHHPSSDVLQSAGEPSSASGTLGSMGGPVDILDMPAPGPVTSFTSSSSAGDSGTMSSTMTKVEFSPPGLVTPDIWQDAHSGGTSSPGSRGSGPITIDVLESEPPSAPEGWRSLAGAVPGRRTTFGVPFMVYPSDDHTSEQGSLHSMRSHLNPSSPRSTGSSAASRRDNNGSTSSRGTRLTGSSLAHSSSVSSYERRRGRPASPSLSAMGPVIPSPNLIPSMPPFGIPSTIEEVPPLPLPVMGRTAIDISGSLATVDDKTNTAHNDPYSPTSSPPLSPMPWAGGLSSDWTPR